MFIFIKRLNSKYEIHAKNNFNLFDLKCVLAVILLATTGNVLAQQPHGGNKSSPLKMPGNEIFSTIQEVVQELEADSGREDDDSEVEKIRALGYIGLIAEGAHHQLHDWMIATGQMDISNYGN